MIEAPLALAALKQLESRTVMLICRKFTLHAECHPFPEVLSGSLIGQARPKGERS